MRLRLAHVMAAMVTATALMAAGQSDPARLQFEAARKAEVVDGDLKGAIEQYRRVADGSNRALAAQALVRMAECYEKLGDPQARTVFERIVREFSDQTDALTVARARLVRTDAGSRAKSERVVPIDAGNDLLGTISADGRFLSYMDRPSGDIAVHDLRAGTSRLLSKAAGGYTAMSRDGRHVAFNWGLPGSREVGLAIVDVQGTDAPQVRRLLTLGYDNAEEIAPWDWSPDGQWLAVRVLRGGGTAQLGLVSVRDGALRVLKSMEWSSPRRMRFSPDGRYIAYTVPVADTRDSHVLVIAVDGGRESTVVQHASENQVMGWSPDGAFLLFASNRNGSFRLWTLPVSDGRSAGTPALVDTSTLGYSPVSLGVTSSGALYAWTVTSNMYIQVAPIDLVQGKLLSDPGASFRVFVGTGGKPTWSPDGQSLAYMSCSAACDRTDPLRIRTMATGQTRELPLRHLVYLMGPADLGWSPDSRSLRVVATDSKGHIGSYLFDALTGEISSDPSGLDPNWAVATRPRGGEIVKTSPDRRYTASIETSDQMSTLLLRGSGGGEPKELLRAPGLDAFGRHGMTWTPDSRAILLMKANGSSKELWLIPVAGGTPRKLDIDVANWQLGNLVGGFTLRPDGRQIAFVAGENRSDVLALENFLPTASPKP